MSRITLMPHQKAAYEAVKGAENVGYFLTMGLGKTHLGSYTMEQYGERVNLIVCQKSKVDDWTEHMAEYHDYEVFDLTRRGEIDRFIESNSERVGVCNYEILFRRPNLLALEIGTLMLDESSLIQNEQAKRSKAVLKMKTQHNILLSGTLINGFYHKLWSQANLLGWGISKKMFWSHFVVEEWVDETTKRVTGYKNVERLKRKLRSYNGFFMRTEEVLDLPEQTITTIKVPVTKDYKTFEKDHIVYLDTGPLVGDMQLTDRLYKRILCSHLNEHKVRAFQDLLESTEDRLVVFYNFQAEYEELRKLTDRPVSVINGGEKDLTAYHEHENSIVFCQYQSASMGVNLQKANKIIYFTLPDGGSENFEQSLKRIHRIGQERPCYYYVLVCQGSIEEDILVTLGVKKGRNDYLWET